MSKDNKLSPEKNTPFSNTNPANQKEELSSDKVNPTLDPNRTPQPQADPKEANKTGSRVIVDADTLSHSGKQVEGGSPNPNIVTINKSTGKQADQGADFQSVDNTDDALFGDRDFEPQYEGVLDIEAGKGMFIPLEANINIDKHLFQVQGEVYRLNQYYSVPALDAEGQEILDQVSIKEFKRNDDKTIKLDGEGKPMTGANFTHLLRRIPIRLYVAKSVLAGDNFDTDGVLIMRVM